jgi:type I restriction enzyme S subunit
MQYLIPRGHENFRFLHYALLNLKLSSFAVGSTIPHIYFKDYKGLNVGVPTLEEQERIVEVLDEAFAAIDKAKANIERNLTNARELFQSRLNDIFSNPSKDWELKPLGETCDIVGRIGFRGYTRNDLVEEGNGAISMSPSNIQGQKLHFGKCTFLSWDKYHESPEIMVREGDVVFCKTGSTYGKCAFVDSLPIETTLNPQLVVFKNIKAEAEFIFYACTSPFFQNQIENMVGGTATPTISQKKIGACLVPTPSIQEQRKLVEHLQKVRTHVEKLEADYQTELDNLEELRQSILEQAFEGKLTETVAA